MRMPRTRFAVNGFNRQHVMRRAGAAYLSPSESVRVYLGGLSESVRVYLGGLSESVRVYLGGLSESVRVYLGGAVELEVLVGQLRLRLLASESVNPKRK